MCRMKTTALLLAIALATPVRAQPTSAPAARAKEIGIAANPNQVRGDEITPDQRRAVEKGLAWLASRDDPAPAWWDGYASPAILWISPVAFVLLVWRYVHRLRRKEEGLSRRSRPAPLDKEAPQ